jgi:membrane-associated phospholipid phosphatase
VSRPAFAVYALFIALFGVLCYFAHRYDYFPGDISISQWLQGINFASMKPLMRFAPYLAGLAVVVGLQLWLRSRRLALISIAAATAAAGLISWLLKLMVSRPRPDAELVQIMVGTQGSSFPSGHVAMATAAGGFIIYLAPRLVKSPAVIWLLRVLVAVIIAAVGFSRIYLGAHWYSDVVGGLFLGGLILYPVIVLYNKYRTE